MNRQAKVNKDIDMLSDFLKCKYCGSNMIKRTSKGKVYYYSNYYKTKKCENNKSISKSIVEEFIKKELNMTEITRLNIDNNINYISVISKNEIEIIKVNGSDNLWICTKKEKLEQKRKMMIVKKVFQKSAFHGINRLMENSY